MSFHTERLHALHAASDLRLGSEQVRTGAERRRSVVADRSADVLRPFGFAGGDAVLVFGVLDGSVVRYLAERVRSVVCVADEPAATLLQARCRGLSNISAVPSLDAVAHRDPFDAVVSLEAPLDGATFEPLGSLIGDSTMVIWREEAVVEVGDLFSTASFNTGSGRTSVADVAASGRINARGDRYESMSAAGLRLRATLYPYPAIESPSVVLGSPFFRDPSPCDLLDRATARRAGLQPTEWREDALAFDRLRVLLLADAARPLMPQKLVVASKQALSDERLDCAVAAWSFAHAGDPSLSAMQAFKRTDEQAIAIVDTPMFDTLVLDAGSAASASAAPVQAGPLTSTVTSGSPSLRDEILQACVSGELEQLTTLLKRWRSGLREYESPGTGEGAIALVSGELFDARIGNVAPTEGAVEGADDLRLMSRAFTATEPVAVETVVVRSLWYLARHLVGLGVSHPWSPAISVDELTLELSALTGDQLQPSALERWRATEADVLAAIWTNDPSDHTVRLVDQGGARSSDFAGVTADADPSADAVEDSGAAAERTEMAEAQAELVALRQTASGYEQRIADLQSQLGATSVAEADEVDELRLQLAEAERLLDRQNDKIDSQSRLMTEVIRKYERAVHERNMVEQGMQSYRRVVTVAKRVMPTEVYFKIRKIVRGH